MAELELVIVKGLDLFLFYTKLEGLILEKKSVNTTTKEEESDEFNDQNSTKNIKVSASLLM